jgi:hypothetical protein
MEDVEGCISNSNRSSKPTHQLVFLFSKKDSGGTIQAAHCAQKCEGDEISRAQLLEIQESNNTSDGSTDTSNVRQRLTRQVNFNREKFKMRHS